MMKNQHKLLFSLLFAAALSACGTQSDNTQANKQRTAPAPASGGVVLYGQIRGDMQYQRTSLERSFIPPQNTERYGKISDNPVHIVAQEPVSTFSIDVDTGSYSNVRRFLNDGRLPPADAVRTEELLNYFDYAYPQPKGEHPFAIHTVTVDSPWQANAKLIKIGIAAENRDFGTLPAANLVFLVDVSGSMMSENKLPLVKKTLRLLTEQLRPQDKVTLITYASGEELILPPTSGRHKDKILAAINRLQAGGSTAGEAAIQLAYKQAQKAYINNGINRILLATDGDFNVGITDFDTLKSMVAEKRKSGISLSTFGYGSGNYNEQLMEQIADAGDGNYSYIDNEQEAKKVLQRQLTSTLATVAQDMKIQVEFNPATVAEYRLVGYENRALRQEDFNNDQVDAGDIGAGHSVTALYEIIPAGEKGWNSPSRYTPSAATGGYANEYAHVRVRYKKPQGKTSILLEQAVPVGAITLKQADDDTRFAIAVASYGQMLRGGKFNGAQSWDNILRLGQAAQGRDAFGLRAEWLELVKIAKSLSAQPPQ